MCHIMCHQGSQTLTAETSADCAASLKPCFRVVWERHQPVCGFGILSGVLRGLGLWNPGSGAAGVSDVGAPNRVAVLDFGLSPHRCP